MNKPLPWGLWVLPGLVGLAVFLLASVAWGESILEVNAREIAARSAQMIIDRDRLLAHRQEVDRQLEDLGRQLAGLEGEAAAVERIRQQVLAFPKVVTDGTR